MGSAHRCTRSAAYAALSRHHHTLPRPADTRPLSTDPNAFTDARNTTGVVGSVANKVDVELIQHPSPRRRPRRRATQSDLSAAPPRTSPTRATRSERARFGRDRRACRRYQARLKTTISTFLLPVVSPSYLFSHLRYTSRTLTLRLV